MNEAIRQLTPVIVHVVDKKHSNFVMLIIIMPVQIQCGGNTECVLVACNVAE